MSGFCVASASADDINWNDSGGGLFDDSGNWSPTQVPDADDTAIFDLSSVGGYDVTFDDNFTNDRLLVRDDVLTLDLAGFAYSLVNATFPDASVVVGESSGEVGSLSISGGTLESVFAAIGLDTGSDGTVTVDGAGSQWNLAESIYVGGSDAAARGAGTLTVQDGGAIDVGGTLKVWNTGIVELLGSEINTHDFIVVPGGTFTHHDGTLTVDSGAFDPGTADFIIDGNEAGQLPTVRLIGGASTPTLNTALTIGENHEGAMIVDGTGSAWDSTHGLYVGSTGTGTLTVQRGGAVTNSIGRLGVGVGANGTITVHEASWECTDTMYVGEAGTGTLTIENGGSFTGTECIIAYADTSNSSVTVDGEGSTFACTDDFESLTVGRQGTGNLTILGGGDVSNVDAYVGRETDSNGSITVNGAGSTWTNGNLYVGISGTGQLLIENGAGVTSLTSSIGYLDGSSGTVTVDGSDSAWTLAGPLYVGYTGTSTGELTIQNGGSVSSTPGDAAYIGDQVDSQGTVTVDGASSRLTGLSTLVVGRSGTGDLVIQNGGIVSNQYASVGSKSSPTAPTGTGTVTVTGDGSTWINTAVLYVGDEGAGQVSILEGGVVSCSSGFLGEWGGSDGTVTVNGAGSTWTNTGTLKVGGVGDGELVIQSGGTVSSAVANVGYSEGSSGIVTIDGTDSSWTSSDSLYIGGTAAGAGGTGLLTIETGGTVTVGNMLKIWAGGQVDLNGGTINAGSIVPVGGGLLNWNSGALNFTGDVTIDTGALPFGDSLAVGAAQRLEVDPGNLRVGGVGTGTLDVLDGGSVTSAAAYVAADAGSTGTVTVNGAGSTWTNVGSLYVGNGGTGQLSIENGASMTSDLTYVGSDATSDGTVILTGAGSTWTNADDFYVGHTGTGQLSVLDGAALTCTGTPGPLYIGHASGASGTVTVDGTGSSSTCVTSQIVGNEGTGELIIRNGGAVSTTNGMGHVGRQAGSDGMVTVTGAGSSWTLPGNLFIGNHGTGELLIEDGATVSDSEAWIGKESGSDGMVTVTGAGSTWANSQWVRLGQNGGTAQLTVETGGTVSAGTGLIVRSDTRVDLDGGTIETGNLFVLDDPAGLFDWTTGTLRLTAADVEISPDANPFGDTLLIDTGKILEITNGHNLNVGTTATGTLTISGGGQVSDATGTIGQDSGVQGTVTVDGLGSTWTNSSTVIGEDGTGVLSIQNEGTVASSINGYIGDNSGSDGTVTINGTGSSWAIGDDLTIGRQGTGILNVTAGAGVSCDAEAYIALQPTSTGTATVTGDGSSWTVDTSLYVGGGQSVSGGAGQLVIETGATVTVTDTLKIWDTGRVDLDGGTLSAGAIDRAAAGVLDWTTGTINFTNDLTLDVGYSPFGDSLAVGTGQVLNVAGGLVVAESDSGTLSIADGNVTSGISHIGNTDTATGVVSLNGAGSLWDTSTLYVGHDGNGTLEILGGANVTSTAGHLGFTNTGDGSVQVSGPGSTWDSGSALNIGNSGNGTLLVDEGGTVSCSVANVAVEENSQGTVTVDDGSTWTSTESLTVGLGGIGSLAVTGGATASCPDSVMAMGSNSQATVTVSGAGSQWDSGLALTVGHNGTAILNVSNGGEATNTDGYIAASAGSDGTATVNGNGSTWNNSGSLYVGGGEITAGGTGKLTVDGDGTVNVGGTIQLWPTGTVELLGSQINTGSFLMEPAATFTHDDGTLTVDGGTFDPGTDDYTIDGSGNPTVTLTGGARTGLAGSLIVGNADSGTLNVLTGSSASSDVSSIGYLSDSSGTVTVDGAGSTWDNGDRLYVGNEGTGELNIQNGAAVSTGRTYFGFEHNAEGTVTVDGAGSTWDHDARMYVGYQGTGELNIQNGAAVSTDSTYFGFERNAEGTVVVDDATWAITGGLYVGYLGTGTMDVRNGAEVSSGGGYFAEAYPEGYATVTVDGATWDSSGTLVVAGYGTAHMRISNGGQVTSTAARIGAYDDSHGTVTIEGPDSAWINSGSVSVGGTPTSPAGTGPLRTGVVFVSDQGTLRVADTLKIWEFGLLSVSSGGLVVAGELEFAGGKLDEYGDTTLRVNRLRGLDDVTEIRSRVQIGHGDGPGGHEVGFGQDLTIGNEVVVGYDALGTLNVLGGGDVSCQDAYIGYLAGSEGRVAINGSGSTWSTGGNPLYVGYETDGTLEVLAGGRVTSHTSYLGHSSGSEGHALVDGAGSSWTVGGSLYVGGNAVGSGGTATLEVSGRGTLEVDGTLKVWPTGSADINGGEVVADSLEILNLTGLRIDSGSMRVANEAKLAAGTSLVLDDLAEFAASTLQNHGTIRGDGTIDAALVNHGTGTVRATAADYLEFSGSGTNTNEGSISVIGGTIEFVSQLTNELGGRISGRGGLVFDGGMTNHGEVNFGADTEIYGDLVNGQTGEMGTDGEIVVSGGASVSFHDDVVHNGVKFKISPNADVVFFGELSGEGSFTGGGGMWIEGTFSPGNSPSWVQDSVNVSLGDDSETIVELAGVLASEPGDSQYDVVELVGDCQLDLDGTLRVALLDGFLPDLGSTFDIYRYAEGNRRGEFDVFESPSWAGGCHFEITYGDTAVTLATVPEPDIGTLLAIAVLLAGGLVGRRRHER